MEKAYARLYEDLVGNRTVINSVTGEAVRLTHLEVLLYTIMSKRYLFFKGLGNKYYDCQEDLAKKIDSTRQSIVNAVRNLTKAGLLKVDTTKVKGFYVKNIYTVFDFKTVEGKNIACTNVPTVVEFKPTSFKLKPVQDVKKEVSVRKIPILGVIDEESMELYGR
jgi:predicted transcriptional regulator